MNTRVNNLRKFVSNFNFVRIYDPIDNKCVEENT